MSEPKIITGGNSGHHNEQLEISSERISQGKAYKDVSTICIVPTRGLIPALVVESWMGLMTPMNQKFLRMFAQGYEVGEAYSAAVEQILSNPELSKWKYILTMEEDNVPPPDGLLKLIESIGDYAAISGLYWTKGEAGQPMIYGNPNEILNFIPQIPQPDSIQECNGLGMGFTLFNLEIFKDKRIPRPFFKTLQEYNVQVGGQSYTQDLYFFKNIRELGYKVAVDTRVRVGHYDIESDMIW